MGNPMHSYSSRVRLPSYTNLFLLQHSFETSVIQKFSHIRERWDTAARADVHALQCGHGVGKADHSFQIPVLKQAIDESAVENVAGAGCVGGGHRECLRFQQPSAVQENCPFRTAS